MSYIEVHRSGGWAILGGLSMQHAVRGICTPTARLATTVSNWQAANSPLGFFVPDASQGTVVKRMELFSYGYYL